MTSITWDQALAWRMRRHLLDPIGDPSVHSVVDRLCGVQAQVASSAELAVRLRRNRSRAGETTRALADGRLIKTWAMRGTLHLLTPESAPDYLSLLAAGRSWERPSWQKYFGVTPDQIEEMRVAARSALTGTTLTREELIAAITGAPGLEHIGNALRSGWGTLLKPLAWQGDLCFGPSLGNRVTFRVPEDTTTRWRPVPPPEEAGPLVIARYLRAHGPSTPEAFGRWMGRSVTRLRAHFQDRDRVAEVIVEGVLAYVMAEDLDELLATKPTKVVRLLGGFDQYVMAPGTSDETVLARERRPAVSKQSGWISPVVVASGRVSGTWDLEGADVRVSWFEERGKVPKSALEREASRLGSILRKPLALDIRSV